MHAQNAAGLLSQMKFISWFPFTNEAHQVLPSLRTCPCRPDKITTINKLQIKYDYVNNNEGKDLSNTLHQKNGITIENSIFIPNYPSKLRLNQSTARHKGIDTCL